MSIFMKIFIGYDSKESIAADVCEYSLQSFANLDVKMIKLNEMKSLGYNRNFIEKQSTEFTFTRFLVPSLCDYSGWALFCDCDFLFLHDPKELYNYINPNKAVYVAQHPNYVPNGAIKMDGKEQHVMFRKNWASLMWINCSHPKVKEHLTLDKINTYENGRWFHQFGWCDDDEIGSLSLEWNTLDNYYDFENPKAIHYTDGGPWFEHYKNTRYAHLWTQKYLEYSN